MLTLKIDAINHVCHSAVFRWSELRWIAFPSVFVRFCWGLTTSNRFEGIPVRFFTTCRPDLLAIFSAWLITAKALLARLRFRPVQTVALEVFFSLAALLFCWGAHLRSVGPQLLALFYGTSGQIFCCNGSAAVPFAPSKARTSPFVRWYFFVVILQLGFTVFIELLFGRNGSTRFR